MSTITTSLKFRLLREDDLEWARLLHNEPNVLKMLGDPTVITKEQQQKWFQNLIKSNTSRRIIVENQEEKIGFFRLDRIDYHNRSVETGGDIHKDFRGKGYAKPIYKKLFNYLFSIGFNRVWLLVAEYNTIGINLYKKLGFQIEGTQHQAFFKEGEYKNLIMMSILKENWKADVNLNWQSNDERLLNEIST